MVPDRKAKLKNFVPRYNFAPVRLVVGQIMTGALVLACAALASQSSAAANFDGHWSVVIVASRGDCDSTFRYGVEIINGKISTDADATVRGRVSTAGAISIGITSGKQSAAGSGRLRGEKGSGVWQGKGTRGFCSGTWTAERH